MYLPVRVIDYDGVFTSNGREGFLAKMGGLSQFISPSVGVRAMRGAWQAPRLVRSPTALGARALVCSTYPLCCVLPKVRVGWEILVPDA